MKLTVLIPVNAFPIVAPFAGAWIETLQSENQTLKFAVAPFAGAWIETLATSVAGIPEVRRSLRGSVD